MKWQDGEVRIIHLPSGEVVRCDQSRSIHRNKAMAMRALKGKLWAIANGAGRKEELVRSYALPGDEEVLDGNIPLAGLPDKT